MKVGMVFPLTGPAGSFGIPIVRGVEIEVDKINAEGGLQIGGDTYLIELIAEDSEYSPEGAATAARKLVERDKVKFILGAMVTHTTLPILPITAPAKIPNFATCWSGEVLAQGDESRYCFKANLTPHEALPPMVDYVFSTHPEVQKVAFICQNSMSCIYGQEMCIDLVELAGKEVVASEYYEMDVTDFYPYLARILAEEPDLIHSTAAVTPHWGMIMKQARELGFEGLFMQEIYPSVALWDIAGVENVDGLITVDFPTHGPLSTPESRDFRDRYIERYGEWDPMATYSAPVLLAVLEAYQIAGTVDDPDLLVETLTTSKFHPLGIDGWFGDGGGFYPLPHQWGYPNYIMEIIEGENTIVGEISVEDQLERILPLPTPY